MTMTLDGSSGTTFPAGGVGNPTSTVVGISDTQTLTNKTLTSPTISSPTISGTPVMSASVLTLGTVVASTSGTSIDFTGIPSWVKRITVMFNGVSTNGTSNLLLQLGTSSGIESSGYTSRSQTTGSAATSTAGFILTVALATAADTFNGTAVVNLLGSNTWTQFSLINHTGQAVLPYAAGIKALAATLDRVRITTVNGTDTFDAGSINIQYE
jgi:hypothetical protein